MLEQEKLAQGAESWLPKVRFFHYLTNDLLAVTHVASIDKGSVDKIRLFYCRSVIAQNGSVDKLLL